MTPARLITVLFAWNDPRTGEPAREFDRVNVELPGGGHVEMEGMAIMARWCDPKKEPRLIVDPAAPLHLKLYGRCGYRLPVWHHARWAGNWCWDACQVTPATARDILAYLHRMGWSMTCAPTNLFNAWRHEVTVDTLTDFPITEAMLMGEGS